MALIEIKLTEKKGRGVFATKNIKKHRLIEKCEIIKFTEPDSDKISNTVLGEYWFAWEEEEKFFVGVICLGYGSLYNHSIRYQNAVYYKKNDCICFYAIKDIKKGEEILIDYGTNPQFSEL
jgi:hypothetical protein